MTVLLTVTVGIIMLSSRPKGLSAALSDSKVSPPYRVYDDFEKVPLHGTFLVDALGDVRWQDVSHEPFTEIDFLLKEAKRLLANDSAKSEVGAK